MKLMLGFHSLSLSLSLSLWERAGVMAAAHGPQNSCFNSYSRFTSKG
jgi:hypothetical protein